MPAKRAPAKATKKRAARAPAAKKRATKSAKNSGWTEARTKAFLQAREETRVVDAYLSALEESSRPGRRRTPASIDASLKKLMTALQGASGVERLSLLQRRRDLEEERSKLGVGQDGKAKENAFVKVARRFGERKGITYGAWREIGVPPRVLQRAGIPRTGSTG